MWVLVLYVVRHEKAAFSKDSSIIVHLMRLQFSSRKQQLDDKSLCRLWESKGKYVTTVAWNDHK